jgi:hypothetical protein
MIPNFITSFTIDVYNFIISDFIFPLRKCMHISQIKLKEIGISLSFYHDNLVDEKYLG